jgi:putative ABC transport system permease protein
MNYFIFILKSALEDFRRNKVRTFLTSLGILIGVASVVLLIAFGLGLKKYIKGQFESLGTNLVVIFPGKILQGGGFRSGGGALGGAKFDEKDVSRLKKIKNIQFVVPVFVKTLTASANGKSEISDLYATTADMFVVRNLEIDKGRIFTKGDIEKRSKIVVIGPSIAKKIYGSPDAAVGRIIKIEGQGFRVAGVLKTKGSGGFGGPDFDGFTYMPYKTAYSFNKDKTFFGIYLKAASENAIADIKRDAKNTLKRRYKEDDFSIIEQTEILNAVSSIFSILNTILVLIGAISLVVGGIGIMNIMYVSVVERTKEIGIRRAIGATKRDILFQFLAESVILSLIGGLGGILFSYCIVLLVQKAFPAYIDITSVMIAFGVSSVIGIVFGVFPARKAAALSPIEAIRYE